MDFVFQGFQSGLPSWLYFVLIAATIGLAWWSYKGIQTIRPFYRYTLIALRSAVFLILLVLLLNPFFKSESIRFEKPAIMVMFDNSSSISVQKGDYRGDETYRDLVSELNFENRDRLDFRFFSVDNDVNPVESPDSLTLDGSETNLYNAVEIIHNNQRDARTAILFTDGIFNKGRNPVFLSRELEIPIFTIALGDTSRQRDLVVQDIVTSASGYLNTAHPVEVNVLNQGFGQEPFQVQLKSGDEIIQSRTVNPTTATSSHTVTFQLDLSEEGLQQYEIEIPEKQGEWTAANNIQPFSIEVLDDKQSILSLAFEIHPDVRLVRSLLLQDENTQLSTRTWLDGNRFIRGDLSLDADTLDLLLLHGYPGRGASRRVVEHLEQLTERVPAILFSTPRSTGNSPDGAATLFPIFSAETASPVEVNIVPIIESTEHPIMELPEVSYERVPSVYAPIRRLEVNPGATVLFNSLFQGVDTGQPVIAIQQVGNFRRAQLNAHGWYRIAQSTNPQARAFIESLIYNIVSWTATQPDNRRLKIQPTQKIFTGNETVSFNAFLTNESGDIEDDGVITVTISGEEIETRLYNMNNIGDGQYRLDIGALPEGIYRFEATAQKGNRTIDTQSGEFSVSGSNVEYVNTTRNDDLLRRIADATGGGFHTYETAGGIWEEMNERGLLDREQRSITNLFYPYQHAFWFILAIVLLGSEWLLRKYVALP
ncbi:MAG: hypothetical protein R3224_01705 [Balneolaceae bacterium]|nr:hypothetical protein [Balneolaceae bacterium]